MFLKIRFRNAALCERMITEGCKFIWTKETVSISLELRNLRFFIELLDKVY